MDNYLFLRKKSSVKPISIRFGNCVLFFKKRILKKFNVNVFIAKILLSFHKKVVPIALLFFVS